MPNYAVHDGTTVVNVIIADSAEIAHSLTGLTAVQTDGEPWVGWTLEVDGWRPPAPHESWVWDGNAWQAPVPYPSDGAAYYWNEEQGDWIEYVAPEPEPEPFTE